MGRLEAFALFSLIRSAFKIRTRPIEVAIFTGRGEATNEDYDLSV
jgi:hypothetical protein